MTDLIRLLPVTPAPDTSPLAPRGGQETLPPIGGVRFAAAEAEVRYKGRLDVALIEYAPGSSMAGVFTRSSTRSAPVLWCEAALAELAQGTATPDKPFVVLVNAGNSNAFTGRNGTAACETLVRSTCAATGCPEGHVFLSSTGVIGEPLPAERITAKLEELTAGLNAAQGAEAARAIMTTDTYPKGVTHDITIGDTSVRISGIAKGSGMIAPDMATMLVYLFTDAAVAQPLLQKAVSGITATTFNAITVDGDTSTSDTLIMGATGASGMSPITDETDPRYAAFYNALTDVMRDLAHQVVRDGEGASKFVEITTRGAQTEQAAHRIGLSIANSPLVKTAIAGEDPNWGRIVMAVGKSGEAADRDRLSIWFGDVLVAENGWVSPTYKEIDAAAHMKGELIKITVDVGVGSAGATVWTCDLTHKYIDINADYRS